MKAKFLNLGFLYLPGITVSVFVAKLLLSILDVFHFFISDMINIHSKLYVVYLLEIIVGSILLAITLRKTNIAKKMVAVFLLESFNPKNSIFTGLEFAMLVLIEMALIFDGLDQIFFV